MVTWLVGCWWLGDAQPLAKISLQQVIISNTRAFLQRLVISHHRHQSASEQGCFVVRYWPC